MTDVELIRDLRALAAAVDIPPPADIVPAVRGDIAAIPKSRRRALAWSAALRPALVTVAAVLAALVVILGASPQARDAVGDWLRVRGIDIGVLPDSTTAPSPTTQGTPRGPTSAGDDPLGLGQPISLQQAQGSVTFDVGVPAALGTPDHVSIDQTLPGGVITMAWAPSTDLPAVLDSDVGALLTVFEADLDEAYLSKLVQHAADVRPVDLAGGRGIWLGGEPHMLVRDADGDEREIRSRLAGNTLLWERGTVTYRLEADLPQHRMRAIAESLAD